jgi:hypothetical protein
MNKERLTKYYNELEEKVAQGKITSDEAYEIQCKISDILYPRVKNDNDRINIK